MHVQLIHDQKKNSEIVEELAEGFQRSLKLWVDLMFLLRFVYSERVHFVFIPLSFMIYCSSLCGEVGGSFS